jgi:pimeloyl-ACP methyl ester carboxylesterase
MLTGGAPKNVQHELAEIISEFHPVGFRLMSKSSAEVDTRDLLPRIKIPVLLVWDEEDQRSPFQIADQVHTAIPSTELVVIPGEPDTSAT